MKKTILIALAILTSSFFIAAKASGPIQVYDGTSLSIGDTIRFGHKQLGGNEYYSIKEPVKTSYGIEYRWVNADLSLSTAKVIDCNPLQSDKIFPGVNAVVVVMTDKHPRELYVDINRGVEKGEIAWVYKNHTAEEAIELTPELMLACCMRSNNRPITDFTIQYLIKVKDSKLYDACMSNEFEYHKVKPEFEKLLKNMIDEFDFTKTYYIKTTIEIGKYNFQDMGYPIDFYGRNSDWERQNFISHGDFYLIATNRNSFKFLSVTPADGEKANKRRLGTSSVAYISPLAYGRVYFTLLNKRMLLPKNSVLNVENMYRQSVIGATIQKVEAYDFQNCDYNLIGTIQ